MTSGSAGVAVDGRPTPRHERPHRIFDRATPPRDWRWIVGGIGRALIIIGLLMFAFVAYQLWGTGIYTAQAQNRLDRDFDKLGIPATTTVAATTTTPAGGSTTAPGTTDPPVASASPSTPSTGSTTPAEPTSGDTVPFPFELPAGGKVLARLQIPSIDVDYKVVEGVGLDDLAEGPGHFPESVLPGQLGNTAIAGHRTTHGAPFYDVDHLDPGQEIIVTYPSIGDASGPRFVYLVTGTVVVSPSAYAAVVPTTDASKATLVLASCTPIRSAAKRIIIRAELDRSQSSPVFAPTPRPAAGPNATIPGDDDGASTNAAQTTAVATTPAASGTTVAGSTGAGSTGAGSPGDGSPGDGSTGAGTDGAGSTVGDADGAASTVATGTADTAGTATAGGGAVTTTPATTNGGTAGTAPAVAPPAASQDAFSGGWFDDGAAWPDILLWGLALVAIVYAGYRLARQQRRIWLGTLAAFVPFVLVLYFWFENINRLLPPGL